LSDDTKNNAMGLLAAAVVGAAVGAGIALLFAPRSGKDTREWLAQRGRDIKDQTTNALAQGKDSMIRAAKEIGRDAAGSVPSARS
jgi:gas vesicle protein